MRVSEGDPANPDCVSARQAGTNRSASAKASGRLLKSGSEGESNHNVRMITVCIEKSKRSKDLNSTFILLSTYYVTAPDTPDVDALPQAWLGPGPVRVSLTANSAASGCLHTLINRCVVARGVRAGVGAVTVGFRTSSCNGCSRRLPRAAARCPWCLWLVGACPVGEARTPEQRQALLDETKDIGASLVNHDTSAYERRARMKKIERADSIARSIAEAAIVNRL